jgi:catechol 2,3-dioxygenase-like lactoylglutathione lyase family enzyme
MNEMNEKETLGPGGTDERAAEELPLLDDIHHLTFVTADMERLISFYERVFGARVTVDLEEEGLRHAFIEVGSHTVLHPFQIPGVEPPERQPMFGRGRLDHFALNAASEEAFWKLRRRVVAEGVGDGAVTDMGSLLNFGFTDPDGGEHEVVWVKPGVPVEAGLRRAEWKTVELPE